MRFAASTFVVAMLLFVGGATSLLAPWAVTAACPVFVLAAVAGAVAMEDRGRGALFPVELLSRGEILSHVREWQSPSFRDKWGLAFGLWIVVYVCALARGRHRVTRRGLRELG